MFQSAVSLTKLQDSLYSKLKVVFSICPPRYCSSLFQSIISISSSASHQPALSQTRCLAGRHLRAVQSTMAGHITVHAIMAGVLLSVHISLEFEQPSASEGGHGEGITAKPTHCKDHGCLMLLKHRFYLQTVINTAAADEFRGYWCNEDPRAVGICHVNRLISLYIYHHYSQIIIINLEYVIFQLITETCLRTKPNTYPINC